MFAKIFSSLFDGSMRGKADLILVFVNMLCHADQEGGVDRHWRAIMDETGLSQERVLAAIKELESPDPESRTPDEEGRRIIRISPLRDWGWLVVNHKQYRDITSEADRRNYMRQYMQDYRKQPVNSRKQKLKKVKNPSVSVSVSESGGKGVSGKGGKFAPSQFQDFIAVYPGEKRPTPPAWAEWVKLVKQGISPDELLAAGKNYAHDVTARGTELKYVAHAENFLAKGKWMSFVPGAYKAPSDGYSGLPHLRLNPVTGNMEEVPDGS